MKNFLQFDRMITGDIIKYVFWALSGLTVLIFGFSALAALFRGEFGTFLLALIATLLGPILIRIYCELMIILFKIHETLVIIRDKGDKSDLL